MKNKRLLRTIVNGDVLVVEPNSPDLPAPLANKDGIILSDMDTALSQAQVVVLLVDHQSFREMDTDHLHGKTVIDTRGVWGE